MPIKKTTKKGAVTATIAAMHNETICNAFFFFVVTASSSVIYKFCILFTLPSFFPNP